MCSRIRTFVDIAHGEFAWGLNGGYAGWQIASCHFYWEFRTKIGVNQLESELRLDQNFPLPGSLNDNFTRLVGTRRTEADGPGIIHFTLFRMVFNEMDL